MPFDSVKQKLSLVDDLQSESYDEKSLEKYEFNYEEVIDFRNLETSENALNPSGADIVVKKNIRPLKYPRANNDLSNAETNYGSFYPQSQTINDQQTV
jgi:hypothetical protein